MASRRRNGRHASCRRRNRSAGAGRRYGRHQSPEVQATAHTPYRPPAAEGTTRAVRAAGDPSFVFPESDVSAEGLIDLNEELIPNPVSTFFGKVKGLSLIDDDIEDSDSVIVDRMLEPQWGDLAVCVTTEGFTMKYVELRDNGEIWLMPGNKDYAPIQITEDNERLLWGIVTHSIRQLRVKKGGKK